MVEILQELFNGSPNTSTIELHDICLDCKREVIIQITPTGEGFGLQGGALFRNSGAGYYAKCPKCYRVNAMNVIE